MATTKNTTQKEIKETTAKEKQVKKTSVRRIPLDLELPCVSNVKGHLVYISKRMGRDKTFSMSQNKLLNKRSRLQMFIPCRNQPI